MIAVLTHAVIVVYLRPVHLRDFDLHRSIGSWFLNHQNLYGCGICYPYMPTAAMYFSLLALVDRSVGFAFRYFTAIAALWATCIFLHRMIRVRFPELAHANLVISVVTIILAGQFILYDLDDGGPHTILLGIMVTGMYLAWTGREAWSACCFGLAIALKVTPGLFVPFFLWKRQWRLAAFTAGATLGWILVPIVWMGGASWWEHQYTWMRVAAGSVIGAQTEFTQLNEDNIRNSGLNPALMRYLVTLAPEHPLRKNDPGYIPVFNASPGQARFVVVAAAAGLLAFFAWQTRRTYAGPGDPEWSRESSAVLILMLFLSPLTWIQHLPWLVPALYWAVAKGCSHDGWQWRSKAALGLYAILTVLLNYEVLGKYNYTVFLSFKPFAIAMFLIFALVAVQSNKTITMSGAASRSLSK